MPSLVRIARYWLPVFLWLAVIATESLFLSSSVTGGWLWHLLQTLHISIPFAVFNQWHHLLRKAGHFTGYGILSLLVFRACYHSLGSFAVRTNRMRPLVLVSALSALAGTLLTAILDEWHQSFDPSRTASKWDVGLDLLGGLVFLTVALFVFRAWRNAAIGLETASA